MEFDRIVGIGGSGFCRSGERERECVFTYLRIYDTYGLDVIFGLQGENTKGALSCRVSVAPFSRLPYEAFLS